MYNATVLEVLIASPSDTSTQREIIRQAVIEWNGSNARLFGVVLLPIMWETHTLPGLGGRPQGLINKQLVDDADILIATFWTRLGSPTGEASSGTVEEINRFIRMDRPAHIYFCEMPVSPLSTDTTQIDAVRAYRDEISKMGLFSSYSTEGELRTKVRDDLTRRIHEMQEEGIIGRPLTTVTSHPSRSGQSLESQSKNDNPVNEIRKALKGYQVSWEAAYRNLDEYSVDSRHDLMRDVTSTLLETIRLIAAINPQYPILPKLEEIVADASKWSTFRVYLDGGKSFGELSDGCSQVLESVRQVVQEDWE